MFKRAHLEAAIRAGGIVPDGVYVVEDDPNPPLDAVGNPQHYAGAVRVPDGMLLRPQTLGGVEIVRGEGTRYHSLFAPYNFDQQGASTRGICYYGLKLNGNYGEQEWLEQRHLVAIVGTQYLDSERAVERCEFRNMMGDGIIVMRRWVDGRGVIFTEQPRNVRISTNYMHGALKNRNGVSLISCSGFISDPDNVYEEIARPSQYDSDGREIVMGMPATIDAEPDVDGEYVEDAEIYGTFINCKAPVAVIAQFAGTRVSRVKARCVIKGDVIDALPWPRGQNRPNGFLVIEKNGGIAEGIDLQVTAAPTPEERPVFTPTPPPAPIPSVPSSLPVARLDEQRPARARNVRVTIIATALIISVLLLLFFHS